MIILKREMHHFEMQLCQSRNTEFIYSWVNIQPVMFKARTSKTILQKSKQSSMASLSKNVFLKKYLLYHTGWRALHPVAVADLLVQRLFRSLPNAQWQRGPMGLHLRVERPVSDCQKRLYLCFVPLCLWVLPLQVESLAATEVVGVRENIYPYVVTT